MAFRNKTKGKTYPILPCIDCGGSVAVPSKPYYMPKARCDSCDRRHRNHLKDRRRKANKPVTYCAACETPFPHGTHQRRKFCDGCLSIKQTEVRDKRRKAAVERLKGHTCKDCSTPLNLDAEFLLDPSKKVRVRDRCPTCMKRNHNRSKARKLVSTDMGSAFRQIKKRCKVRNLPFDLTLEDLAVPELCPVFGTPLIPASLGGANPMMPSVDRHEPEKGYVRGNIVIMSHRANSLKSNATFEEIEALYHYLKAKNQKKAEKPGN